MEHTVWVITGRGIAEAVATGKTEGEAQSIARHPSLSGSRVVVVPSWAPAPALN
jgi:hypothetical protein